jgi:transcription-repair coupling factor (superfamily II helicase)
LRKEVDVLTLSATPIPRTMHMALVGVRDMSTMETPPEERLPIQELRCSLQREDDSRGDTERAGTQWAGVLRP